MTEQVGSTLVAERPSTGTPAPCAITSWCTDRGHGALKVETSKTGIYWSTCQRTIAERSFDNDHRIIEVSLRQEKALYGWRDTGGDGLGMARNVDGPLYVEVYDFTDDDVNVVDLTPEQAGQLAEVLRTMGEGRWLADALSSAVAVIKEG